MKLAARVVFAGTCVVAGTAAADPDQDGIPPIPDASPTAGVWLDAGALIGHAVVPGRAFTSEMVQFAPRISIHHHLYVAGELDFGHLTGVGPEPEVYGMVTPGMPAGGIDLTGNIAMEKAVVGGRLFAGAYSGAVELAAGVREIAVTGDVQTGSQVESYFGGVYEAYGRLDFWATPKLTIGATANLDLVNRADVSAGLVVGVHFLPYDGESRSF